MYGAYKIYSSPLLKQNLRVEEVAEILPCPKEWIWRCWKCGPGLDVAICISNVTKLSWSQNSQLRQSAAARPEQWSWPSPSAWEGRKQAWQDTTMAAVAGSKSCSPELGTLRSWWLERPWERGRGELVGSLYKQPWSELIQTLGSLVPMQPNVWLPIDVRELGAAGRGLASAHQPSHSLLQEKA